MPKTGVRANALVNFKGDPYLTRPDLEEIIGGDVEGLIDDETGNLKSDLNPIHITSMERATPSDKDAADKKDQDFNNVKFIGNCKVQYGDDGTITIRIGDNLNSSLYNTKDGISNATVTGAKSGDASATPSADYAGADGSTAFQVFQAGDKITASTGSSAATAGGATDGTNGTTTHFNDNENGKFKVYIKKGDTTETYVVGAITGNGTYYGKLNGEGNNVTGIACTVTNFGAEAMSAKGATGYMANVNFTLTPSNIYSDSTTFQVVKIEMCEGDSAVATWNATNVNGTYMYIKETTKPGTPTSADYTINNPTYKWISGVKYIVDTTTFTATAEGMKNIGYPAYVNTKANVSPNSGNAWFTAVNDSSTGSFTTWTTAQDGTMSYSKSGIAINKGTYSNPQVVIKGQNINGAGSTATSAKTNNALLVCDSNGYVTSGHGSITLNTTRYKIPDEYDTVLWDWETYINEENSIARSYFGSNNTVIGTASSGDLGHLQIYDGFIQYPDTNFSSYNGGGNPDYSNLANLGQSYDNDPDKCNFNRYFCTRLGKSGVVASGTLTLTTSTDPRTALTNGYLAIYVTGKESDVVDVNANLQSNVLRINDGIATAYGWSNGATTCPINFEFSQESDYGDGGVYVLIVMKYGCTVKIGNVTLA
jgi:hypothetical protein